MTYELKLQNWSGPLEKLLALIEEREMEISAVSLAAVTDDFLKYLENLRAAGGASAPEDLRILSDFIVVAARLILIKSKSLLPELALTAEEERDIKDLEARLALYRRLQDSLKHVQSAWRGRRREFGRPYFMNQAAGPAVFYPGGNLAPAELAAALARVYESLQKFALETATIENAIISLEEKMQEIVRRMEEAATARLSDLGRGSKEELLVAFLAVLHLAREQLVFLEQSAAFSDIIVRKTSGTGGSARLEPS